MSIVAEYFFDVSICMAGGAENCLLDALDTEAPWAAGEAAGDADADGEAAGLAIGESALETWAAELGVLGARVGAAVAAG